jgi:hypothetical protein
MIKAIRNDATSFFSTAGLALGVITAVAWFLVALSVHIPSRFGLVNLFLRFPAPVIVGLVTLLFCNGVGELCESVIDRTRNKNAASIVVAFLGLGAACACFAYTWTIGLGDIAEIKGEIVRFIGAELFLRVVGPLFAALIAIFLFLIVARTVQWLLGRSRTTTGPASWVGAWPAPPPPPPTQTAAWHSEITTIYVDKRGVAARATSVEQYYAVRHAKR